MLLFNKVFFKKCSSFSCFLGANQDAHTLVFLQQYLFNQLFTTLDKANTRLF